MVTNGVAVRPYAAQYPQLATINEAESVANSNYNSLQVQLRQSFWKGLSGTFNNPRYSDPRIFQMNSTIANTNIVWHGGKLLALEEAHAPFSLDPATLMPVNGGVRNRNSG